MDPKGSSARLERSGPRLLFAVLSLAATLSGCGQDSASRNAPAPNFIVVVVDMLRPDHLGIYGYEKNTSPRIDELAENGLVFDAAYAPGTWTYASTVSLFTGLYPSSHGASRDWEAGNPAVLNIISDPSKWLPPKLAEREYDTLMFHTHSYLRAAEPSWQDAFGEVRDLAAEPDGGQYIDTIFWAVHDWLRSHSDQPFFMYVHSLDVHGPWTTLRPLEEDYEEIFGTRGPRYIGQRERDGVDLAWREKMRAYWPASKGPHNRVLYDGHIRLVDSYIGRLYDELVDLGIADNTYLILTSDHGESFGEHDFWGHGHGVYEEMIRIPLIVGSHRHTQLGRRIPELVNSAGLLPTILDLAGTNVDSEVDAPSFARLLEPQAPDSWRYLSVSESVYYESDHQAVSIDPRWKLITDLRSQQAQLFDLTSDPDELSPLGPEDLEGRAADKMRELIGFRDRFYAHASQQRLSKQEDLSEEEIRRLRALGYLQ